MTATRQIYLDEKTFKEAWSQWCRSLGYETDLLVTTDDENEDNERMMQFMEWMSSAEGSTQ